VASIIIIGDEILSGRTADTNSHFLCKRLHELGIRVSRITTIPDKIQTIVETTRSYARRADYVLITGGIGPTPDDLTRQAIALAFNRQLVRHPEAERIVRDAYREKINHYRLEMTRLPKGAKLIKNPRLAVPGFIVENVFVFPGVPQLMREMFEQIAPQLREGRFYELKIATDLAESEFSEILHTLKPKPGVSVGSYPTLHEGGNWSVELVISGTDEAGVAETAGALETELRNLERSLLSNEFN